MVRPKYVASKTPKQSKSRFQSLAAKGWFDRVISEKSFIPDKGFHPTYLEAPQGLAFLSWVVKAFIWEQLCAPREILDIDIVQEFYSNLWEN